MSTEVNGDQRGVVEWIVVEGQTDDHNWLGQMLEMVYCMCVWQKKKAIEVAKESQKESSCMQCCKPDGSVRC